ncbi:hypothetical protein T439DRAFT_355586 [Meredithblackwellia eburnea MCA 4105]
MVARRPLQTFNRPLHQYQHQQQNRPQNRPQTGPSLLSKSLQILNSFIPSTSLVLRSAVLASTVIAAITLAVSSWIVFYKLVGVQPAISETVWFQYGHFRPPYADLDVSPLIANDQAYDVNLQLTVPTSARNVELGNFMVSLVLVTQSGQATVNVSRPSTLRYRSPLSHSLTTLSPLSLLSVRSADVQQLSIPLVEDAVLKTRRSQPVKVELEMGRKDAHADGWRRGEVGEVQVYDAHLKYVARMRGIRYFLYHHPIISFLIFVPTFLFFELLTAALLWGYFIATAKDAVDPPTPTPIGGARYIPLPGRPFPGPPSSTAPTDEDIDDDNTEEKEKVKLEDEDVVRDEERRGRTARFDLRMEGEEDRLQQEGEGGSETERLTETETEGEGTETESAGEWEGVKREDAVDEDTATAGSGTTRASTSTFGPSIASTSQSSSSAATGTSAPQ